MASRLGISSDIFTTINILNDASTVEEENFNYTSEIQDMMYGFGDSSQPLVESAQLVGEVVHQQIVSICIRAMEVAEMRGAKVIEVQDLLFLLRNNKAKLHRILKYLALKEMKRTMNATINDETVTESTLESRSNFGKNTSLVKFLLSIDQTGEIEDILFSAGFEAAWTGRAGDRDGLTITDGLSTPLFSPLVYFDAVKHDRALRADEMASAMDRFSYVRFSEARRVCFTSARSGGAARFWEWIATPKGKTQGFKRKRKDSLGSSGSGEVSSKDEEFMGKPSAMTIEVLSLMAFETVAQIVDLALLVRRDASLSPEDRLMPPLYFNSSFPVYQDLSRGSKADARFRPYPHRNIMTSITRTSSDSMVRCPQPLLPMEIHQAIRRYWSVLGGGPLAHFSREPAPSPTRRFLCC